MPPEGRCWGASPRRCEELRQDNRLYFGTSGNNVPRVKRFLSEVQDGIVCQTLWLRTDVGDNQEAKREVKEFNIKDVFATPKPERLIERILSVASRPVIWSSIRFAGSGTTGAVAHKMGRRWIMIELGEHCHTHIIPRLRKVVDGQIEVASPSRMNGKAAVVFDISSLSRSLLERDAWDNWVISKQYNPEMLAEAYVQHMSFTYAPSDS